MMDSWTGLVAQAKSEWQKFLLSIGETGLFEQLKNILSGVIEKIKEMKESGELKEWSDRIASVITSIINLFTTLAGIFATAVDVFGPFLPAIAEVVISLKTLQVVLGGVIGMPLQFAAKIFALVKSFEAFMGMGIIDLFKGLRTAILEAAAASGVMQAALAVGAIGAFLFMISQIASLIEKIQEYRKEAKELAEAQNWLAEETEYVAGRAEKYNKILEDLGFKTMKEFNKAVKEGLVVFNEQTGAWEKVTEATNKQKKSYEELIASVKFGSEEFFKIKNKELETLKATIDYEIALEEDRYKNGEISLEEFLTFKERRTEDYTNRILYLLDLQIEALKKSPEENLEKIADLEEKRKQIITKSLEDQLKLNDEYNKELDAKEEDALDSWNSLQEMKISSLEANLQYQDSIEKAAVEAGQMRESEAMENSLARTKIFYEKKIEYAQDILRKLEDMNMQETDDYRSALIDKETLQEEYAAYIKQTEQDIVTTKKNEQQDALEFYAELVGDYELLDKISYEDRLAELQKFYDQGLLSAEQYYDALSALTEEYTSEFERRVRETSDFLTQMSAIIAERAYQLRESVKSLYAETYSDVKEYFGDAKDALEIDIADVEQMINTFMQQTTWTSYDTFWNASIFEKKMVEMVGENIYEWAGRLADYINYIKGLMASLEDTIYSYQMELARLQENKLGELELWYGKELADLEEQYKNELGKTKEYYEAQALLLEIYKEKKAQILEDMAADEEKLTNNKLVTALSEPSLQEFKDILATEGLTTTGGDVDVTGPTNINFNMDFDIETYDREGLRKWVQDELWPELEYILKLKGIKL